MIHCNVDVDHYDHPKFLAAGAEAAGFWLAALAYTRKHRLDGMLPKSAFMGFYGGKGAAAALKRLLSKDVELMADHGDTVEVLKYALKNQTKAQIEAVIQATRERVTRHRNAKHVTPTVTALHRDLCNSDRNGDVPRARSSSRSHSRSLDPDPDVQAADPEGFAGLTEAVLASCAMAGTPVPTAEDVIRYRAFCADRGRTATDAGFLFWMTNERRFAATRRVSGPPEPNATVPHLRPFKVS